MERFAVGDAVGDAVGESMYRLRISTHFNAAHRLNNYDGECSRLHGHTWKVEVFVIGDKLKNGMLVDLKILKKRLREVVSKLDHTFLNDIKEIGNPTLENISRYIFNSLKLPEGVKLEKVRVWESEDSWGEYY
jgi:6-pyruvoyltetrahydropterin/6-carboxytetrahydropterin synthase